MRQASASELRGSDQLQRRRRVSEAAAPADAECARGLRATRRARGCATATLRLSSATIQARNAISRRVSIDQ